MNKKKILYVEDDVEIRENYSFILENYFGNITSTGCGKEALDLYKNNEFDLLILDINLPNISGLELASEIRKKDMNTKIIMLTAYSDRERLLQAVHLKLDSYLIKPVENKKFIETIRTNLKDNTKKEESSNLLIRDNLFWNKEKNILTFNAENIKLTKKERALMESLVSHKGSFLDKDTLILKIWENDFTDFTHNQKLTQLVYRLNKKLMNICNSSEAIISNNYSIGYKLECLNDH